MDKWDRLLREQNIRVGMKARRNLDAIRELAELFEKDEAVHDFKQFVADLIRREQQASTGIGKGVAVPHVHEDIIERQLLAIGVSREGIDFASIDGEPVHIVALLATPLKHHKQHMELLAALSRLLQYEEVRRQIIEAPSPAVVIDAFANNRHLV